MLRSSTRSAVPWPLRRPGSAVRPALREAPRIGLSLVTGHVGELLQGMFEGADGRLHRALLTLPDPTYCSEAIFVPGLDEPSLVVAPEWKVKAAEAARLTLIEVGAAGLGGTLTLETSFPEGAAGWGLGTSTADVTATIEAVARSAGRALSPAAKGRLAVRAEVAADSLAFGQQAVLFAQREGIVLEDFGPLPALSALAFNTDPGGVDTLALPPANYDWQEIESFRVLRAAARRAIRAADPELLGRVATASARINQRHLPLPHFDRLLVLADEIGALGLAISHSGTAAALLLEPERALEPLTYARDVLADLGCTPVWTFHLCPGLATVAGTTI